MSGLLEAITQMMTDPTQAQNEIKIESIMNQIRDLKINKASEQLRLAACHFLTMYHTRKAMTIGMADQQQQQQQQGGMAQIQGGPSAQSAQTEQINIAAVERFKESQRIDMLLGWNLLNIKGSNSQIARTARVLKIEVAQRLEDSVKLKEAFDDLMSRALTEEENMVAFTAAPFLGDWKAMMSLGKRIERMPGGLEQLHLMSMQLPIPDFTLIYTLCKEHKLYRQPTPAVSSLVWTLSNVARIRVKFRDVDCGQFEAKRQELLDEINKQGDVEWEDVPTITHVHIKRMGALCQAVSFGEIPMMLNGPWLEGRINVRGRAEMPLMSEAEQMAAMQAQQMGGGGGGGGFPDPSTMTMLVQEEEWDLKMDAHNSKMYKGVYTLKQRPHLPPHKQITSEHAPVNMVFDCELFLGQIAESNSGGAKKNNNSGNHNGASASAGADCKTDDGDGGGGGGSGSAAHNTNGNNDEEEQMNPEEEEDTAPCAPTEALITEFDGLELD